MDRGLIQEFHAIGGVKTPEERRAAVRAQAAAGKFYSFTGREGVTYWMQAGFIEELRPKG